LGPRLGNQADSMPTLSMTEGKAQTDASLRSHDVGPHSVVQDAWEDRLKPIHGKYQPSSAQSSIASIDGLPSEITREAVAAYLPEASEEVNGLSSCSTDAGSEELPLLSDQSQPVELVVECVFLPFLSAVSTANNTFCGRCDLDLSWAISSNDLANFKADPISYRPEYAPDVVAMNGNDVNAVVIEREHGGLYDVKEGFNHVRLRFAGEFITEFDIGNFPFDFQNLMLILSLSHTDASRVVYNVSKRPNNCFVHTRYMALPEYQITGTHLYTAVIDNFSTIIANIHVTRNPHSYVLSLMVPTFLVGIVALVPFCMTSLSDRVAVESTLMLSMIAMLYVSQEKSAEGSSVTILDRYMYETFAFVTAVLFAFVMVSFTKERGENIWAAVCIGLFAMIQIDLVIRSVIARNDRKRHALKMIQKVRKILDKQAVTCSGESFESAIGKKMFKRSSGSLLLEDAVDLEQGVVGA